MCFGIGSQHLGCWGQNTSRIQNKEVCATLCLQAVRQAEDPISTIEGDVTEKKLFDALDLDGSASLVRALALSY